MAAEAKGIADPDVNVSLAGGVRHIIQVTDFIRIFQINSRRDDAFLNTLNQGNGFQAPCSTQGMPGHRFIGCYGNPVGQISEQFFDRQCLGPVTDKRARGMGADHIHFSRRDSSLIQRQFHRLIGSDSFRMGSYHVIGIRACAIADYLSINYGIPPQCMGQCLQNNYAAAFPHNKPVTVHIKRAACFVRLIIKRGQCCCISEAGQRYFVNGRFSPSGYHHIGTAVADQPECFTYGCIANGTGSHW
ncbi:hypothetical protein D3C73_811490 [compost metagenome]